jgi:hypothetical protein
VYQERLPWGVHQDWVTEGEMVQQAVGVLKLLGHGVLFCGVCWQLEISIKLLFEEEGEEVVGHNNKLTN